jgi:hypothetical protein
MTMVGSAEQDVRAVQQYTLNLDAWLPEHERIVSASCELIDIASGQDIAAAGVFGVPLVSDRCVDVQLGYGLQPMRTYDLVVTCRCSDGQVFAPRLRIDVPGL